MHLDSFLYERRRREDKYVMITHKLPIISTHMWEEIWFFAIFQYVFFASCRAMKFLNSNVDDVSVQFLEIFIFVY